MPWRRWTLADTNVCIIRVKKFKLARRVGYMQSHFLFLIYTSKYMIRRRVQHTDATTGTQYITTVKEARAVLRLLASFRNHAVGRRRTFPPAARPRPAPRARRAGCGDQSCDSSVSDPAGEPTETRRTTRIVVGSGSGSWSGWERIRRVGHGVSVLIPPT